MIGKKYDELKEKEKDTHESFMRRAITLAKEGVGYVNPNPPVGAVIVKKGKVIGEGYHKIYGGLHAEREALASCRESPEGSTLYVTLEPCCHYGKTSPCTDAIVEAGITSVVIGIPDPNAKVFYKGIEYLRSRGIEVICGVCEEECNTLIRFFRKHIVYGRPYMIMKYAMTMDGKIATAGGESKWISGSMSRHRVHEVRSAVSAVMIGINTLLTDDPLLTCRLKAGHQPMRIICDTFLRTPLHSNIVRTAKDIPTYIVTSDTCVERWQVYEQAGCNIFWAPEKKGHIDLTYLMEELGKKGIDSILLEGGSELNWSALVEGLVDEIHVYMGGKIWGGNGKSPVTGIGVDGIHRAIKTKVRQVTIIEEDVCIESEVIYPCLQEL